MKFDFQVACCNPVMSQDPENLWLACFGPSVPLHSEVGCRMDTPLSKGTNAVRK